MRLDSDVAILSTNKKSSGLQDFRLRRETKNTAIVLCSIIFCGSYTSGLTVGYT